MPDGLLEFNNLIFFNASTDGFGQEVWKSDGTNSNTVLVDDINSGNENGATYPLNLSSAVLNNELYFIATDGSSSGEIWKTDGINSEASQITKFLNGKVTKLTTVGNFIFFLLSIDNTLQVWKTDGTTEGTVLVKDGLSIWNTPTFQGKCNDNFIFTFQAYGSNKSKVWSSDGTSIGTFPITDEIDGNGSGPGGTSALSQYIEFNNKLYFVSRNYLYETDGTSENTKIVTSLWNAQNNLVAYSDVIEANNKLYFQFFSVDNYQLSIWESDGTSANTNEIYTKNSSQYFFPSNLSEADNLLIFCSSNDTGGTVLCSLNLDDNVTRNLIELSNNALEPFMFINDFYACKIHKIVGDEFFISAFQDNSFARKGWISNVSKNTTDHVSALDNIAIAISYNQILYYLKDYQLWKYTNSLNTESVEVKSSLSIYPNPSSDFIKFKTSHRIENISIFDLSGRMIINTAQYQNNQVDISQLSLGTYLIKFQLNGGSITKKIIKK
ncbi:T9SS type A sorting domain-containing protein [Formosa sp. A9]|uniref:T9SS type A sorting domain-containing protein n=1 Tax=Formosa sp. A9 TaxID=3442641 RepID=UPI003EBB85FB